jgi:hypothetical protein
MSWKSTGVEAVPDVFAWDADWHGIDDPEDARAFALELTREVCREHVMFGRKVTAIGRRKRRDDFLYLLDDGAVAQVHLTWSIETDPRWPDTVIYPDFAAWQAVPPEDR